MEYTSVPVFDYRTMNDGAKKGRRLTQSGEVEDTYEHSALNSD
jgi:hypothetical protein